MKKTMCVPGIASILLLIGASPSMALVTPALQISAGTYTVTIDGSGNVTGCTAPACSITATPSAGTLTVTGTVGSFSFSISGSSKGSTGLAAMQPAMDLQVGSLNYSGTGSGTLTVAWTDIGFAGGAGPTTITPVTSYEFGATGNTSYYLYVDNSNNPLVQTSADLSASLTDQGSGAPPSVQGTGTQVTANPFAMTMVEVVTIDNNGGSFTNDFGAKGTPGSITVTQPPTPKITLTKSVVGSTTVSPFTKVTYNYLVTNTGTATVTNLVVNDDNATPSYPADDFTATCPSTTLAPGASETCTATVYPPVAEGANDCTGKPFNYSNYHPGGTLICKNLPNGDFQFHWLIDQDICDNTYGNGASPTWPSGNSSYNFLSDYNAEFQLYDSKGNKCLDFVSAYAGYNPSRYISGWGSGGVQNLISGNGGYIVSSDTTLSRCLNRNAATAQCLSNSPSDSPDWIPQVGYIVEVKSNCFGSNGFGSVQCPVTSHGTNKTGQCDQHECQPVNSTETNSAYATAVYNGTTVMSNTSMATITIDVNPKTQCTVPLPPECNVYGKSHNQCKPQNGGHDNDGYAYCADLLPKQITCDNTNFELGTGSDRCAASGGTVPLPSGKYSALKCLGSAVNGAQYDQKFIITYTDGSTSTAYQNMSDWCYPSNFSGEKVAQNMPYRITPNGSQQYGNINMYEYSIPINNTKTVKSVTLPDNRNAVFHAITLCP